MGKRAFVFMLAAALAGSLAFPGSAFALVRVDETELAQGENAVGGGTATLVDTSLNMVDVTANELYTNEDLSVSFNGGNDIENVNVDGAATVDLSFQNKNEVEEVHAAGTSSVTINANGNNEFEEIKANDSSNLTINVTGENEFEEIVGHDEANITIQGTNCQKKDIINVGEDEEDTAITTERGTLTIDHVTVNLEAEEAVVGSEEGDVVINTSKVAGGDDNEYTYVTAGGTMEIVESVIDITGTVHAAGMMTIDHSDVSVEAPDSEYGDKSPYRVYSETGVELIREENGEVLEGELDDQTVWYVDTGDGDDVDLRADGDPAYYGCNDEQPGRQSTVREPLPKTGDESTVVWPTLLALAGMVTVGFAARLRKANA